jgi:hypothetical protein
MTLKSRAVDDSGNLENAGSGINVTVVPRSRQILCSITQPRVTMRLGD